MLYFNDIMTEIREIKSGKTEKIAQLDKDIQRLLARKFGMRITEVLNKV